MSKPDPRAEKSDRDVLENLGALIGGQIKKGMNKLEEIIADSKADAVEAPGVATRRVQALGLAAKRTFPNLRGR